MSNDRDSHGRFIERVSLSEITDVLAVRDEPLTAKEVGEEVGITNRAALNKLNELADSDRVERKKVGGRSVIWWLSDEQRSRGGSAKPLRGLVGLFGDDEEAAKQARERSEEWGAAFDQQMMSRVDDFDGETEDRDAGEEGA